MLRAFLFSSLLFPVILNRANTRPAASQKFRFNESVQVDGSIRTYTVVVPPDYYRGETFPLVIALHGGGGSGAQFERNSRLSAKARREGFIVVYPDGTGMIRTWNAGNCCGYAGRNDVDDVKFISRMIDQLVKDHKADIGRVYATGISNGGMMCYRLACELGNKIAAIAPVAAVMVTNNCPPVGPVPVLHIHSVLDRNVPVKGGRGKGPSGTNYPPLDSTLAFWSGADGCTGGQQLVDSTNLYNHYLRTGCRDAPVKLYLTKDGGHSRPGSISKGILFDKPSDAFDADDLIWDFFRRFGLR